jgi:hypothetical protein
MVRRRGQRAVSNHGSRFELAAILRDALASLGLLRMRRINGLSRSPWFISSEIRFSAPFPKFVIHLSTL